MLNDRYIVDGNDGNVVDTLGPHDRILRGETTQRYHEWVEQQHTDKDKWVMTDFMKVSAQEQQLWNRDLSINEKAFLFSMQPYLSFDNDLCDTEGNQLGSEAVVYLSGVPRNRVFEVLKSLTRKFILYQGKNGRGRQYIINPWIMCKGVYVKRDYKALFRDYRIRMLGNVRWGDLKGFQK